MSDSQKNTHEHISEQCDADQQTSAQQQADVADMPGADVPQSDFRDTMRDDALAAAEKGLEAARAALAAAEKRLAEAQREAACRRAEKSDSSNAIPVEPVGAATQPAETPVTADQSADATMTTEQSTVERSQVGYAVPQGVPQTPASAPYSYSGAQDPYQDPRSAQGYTTQGHASQSQPGAYSQMPPNQDGAGSFSQPGAYQQPYQAYQPQGQPNQAYMPYDTTYQQQGVPRQPPVQPHYAPPLASRDHVAAGLLAIFLGGFGVHKFYLGYNTQGFIMLALGLIGGVLSFGLALGVVWIIAFIEGIIYLVKPQSEFERTYIYGKREWF